MTDLQPLQLLPTVTSELQTLCPEANHLVANISNNMLKIGQDSKAFYKAQSQFMDKYLTVHHTTPLRNLRQIIAELTVTLDAIAQNTHKLKLLKLDIAKHEKALIPQDKLDAEIFLAELQKKKYDLARGEEYLKGALKKASNFIDLYNTIASSNGIGELTEAAFEEQEEEYHIKKVFQQSLAQYRALGSIDAGNLEYLFQIGINGSSALHDIKQHVKVEQDALKQGRYPTYQDEVRFLDRMVERHAGCTKHVANAQGKPEGINYNSMLRLYNEKN